VTTRPAIPSPKAALADGTHHPASQCRDGASQRSCAVIAKRSLRLRARRRTRSSAADGAMTGPRPPLSRICVAHDQARRKDDVASCPGGTTLEIWEGGGAGGPRATVELVTDLARDAETLPRYVPRPLFRQRQQLLAVTSVLSVPETKDEFAKLVVELSTLGYFGDAFGSRCADCRDDPGSEASGPGGASGLPPYGFLGVQSPSEPGPRAGASRCGHRRLRREAPDLVPSGRCPLLAEYRTARPAKRRRDRQLAGPVGPGGGLA
jgi:hypothetical protein